LPVRRRTDGGARCRSIRWHVQGWPQTLAAPSLPQRAALEQALRHNRKLNTIELMQQDLTALWRRSGTSKEQLLAQLEDWCRSAEGSGIDALREFSRALQSYDLALGETK
jgi:stearoyl-CoA desaturase (delta-9 desaturase)